ncbi:ASCH domain-containing protein [Paenibacillus chartarius]|uniref:ASCH domain-containing protein n=1 Tax=Paenibacillus chartarius TaxID=747481 RepID=A0ABV6DJ19_9BACL
MNDIQDLQPEGQLPPKTCSVDRLVTKESEVSKVLDGLKTATRRNGRYADVGEIMDLQGQRFEITKVYRQSLGELTDEHARQEGYANVDAYRDSILAMHPGMPWLPHMKVWVHEFRKVSE